MSAFQRNSMFMSGVLILVGIFCSAWFRFHVANSDPLWLDELHSVWAINRPTDQVQEAAAIGNPAPLYFWSLKFSGPSGADSPISFRWLSIVCSVLTSVSLGGFVWYWSRSVFAAALAVWLNAIDPNMIFYGSEARPYALLMLIAVWQFFAFVCCGIAQRRKDDAGEIRVDLPETLSKKWFAVTIVLSAAMLLVHHTGILLLAAECLVVMAVGIWHRKHLRWVLVSGCLMGTVVVVFGMQYESMLTIANRRTQWSELSSLEGLLTAYAPPLVCLGMVPLAILLTAFWVQKTEIKRLFPVVGYVLAWAILPATLAGFCDWFDLAPLAMFRYTVVGAVALPILAGLCVGAINHGSIQFVCLPAVVAISIFAPIPERSGKQWLTRPANEFALREAPNLFSGAPIRMRFESWDSVVNLLANSKLDVYLFANLLEDELANRSGMTKELKDYLKFPLSHSGVISSTRIIPARSRIGISESDSMQLSPTSGQQHWVVIRGDPNMVGRIKNWFHERCGAGGIETYHFTKDDQVIEWLTVLKVSFDDGK